MFYVRVCGTSAHKELKSCLRVFFLGFIHEPTMNDSVFLVFAILLSIQLLGQFVKIISFYHW